MRVLLVDDEPAIARGLARFLTAAGHTVTTASDGTEAVGPLGADAFDVIVSDIRMPEMDGLTLLCRIRESDLDVPVVFMTGSPELDTVMRAMHPMDLVDDELGSAEGALTPFANCVVLEVTERATPDEVHGVGAVVARLRALGYRIALDDLGAGYAGLSSFAQLEPEIVKVDMSLVGGIHESAMKQKLFRSFASLCRELNTEIVAEGVEVAEERDCLNTLGGDLYQGYLFARPGRGFPAPVY